MKLKWVSGHEKYNFSGNGFSPSARSLFMMFQIDENQLLLFGGALFNSIFTNDLWVYTIDEGKWDLIKGYITKPEVNESRLYGIVYNDQNLPGGRRSTQNNAVYINDDEDELLIYWAGVGYDEGGNYGELSEFWKINVKNNFQFKYVPGGSCDKCNCLTVYGINDIYDENNRVGARRDSIFFKVNNDDEIILGFGHGYGETVFGKYNDMFKWRISDGSLKFIKGSKVVNHYGNYSVKGAYTEFSLPCHRTLPASWQVNNSLIYIYGGFSVSNINDLWVYNEEINQYKWLQGPSHEGPLNLDQDGIYKVKGVFANESLVYPVSMYSSIHFKLNDDYLVLGPGYWWKTTSNSSITSYNSFYLFSTKREEFMWIRGKGKYNNGFLGEKNGEFSEDVLPPSIGGGTGLMINDREFFIFGGIHYSWHAGVVHLYTDLGFLGTELMTYCNGIDYLSPSVCSGKGECIGYTCVCESWEYTGNNCEKFSLKKRLLDFLNDRWWVLVIIVSSVLGLLCFVIAFLCICIMCKKNYDLKSNMKKFTTLKNVDLYLQEEKADENLVKIKLNKGLFKVNFEEVKLLETIAEGGSDSIVYKAKFQRQIIAFKVFRYSSLATNESAIQELEKEISLCSSLNHLHIIRFLGACLRVPRIGILLEYCANKDCITYLRKQADDGKQVDLKEKIRMLFEISTAMEYLHSKNVIHRDLKGENILLDKSISVKIIDFGLSKIIDRMSIKKTKRIGTSLYMAPEVTLGNHYGEKVDVFSYGIVMFEILEESKRPYSEDLIPVDHPTPELLIANDRNLRPKINQSKYPRYLIEIMQTSWDHDANGRMSFKDISSILEKHVK